MKRIPLNPKSAQLNEKVKREAKLFSKLNHEHLVRYNAAWIETAAAESSPSTTTLSSGRAFFCLRLVVAGIWEDPVVCNECGRDVGVV